MSRAYASCQWYQIGSLQVVFGTFYHLIKVNWVLMCYVFSNSGHQLLLKHIYISDRKNSSKFETAKLLQRAFLCKFWSQFTLQNQKSGLDNYENWHNTWHLRGLNCVKVSESFPVLLPRFIWNITRKVCKL